MLTASGHLQTVSPSATLTECRRPATVCFQARTCAHLLHQLTASPQSVRGACASGRLQLSQTPAGHKRSSVAAAAQGENHGRPQAIAQQAQEAPPNTQNAESARKWIAAWRSKQASSAKGSDHRLNGAQANGSTPSNQPGQATAPKAPGEAPPKAKPKTQPSKGFNNINRFIVPEDKIQEFEETWQERESVMQQMPGFKGFSLEQTEGSDFVTTSKWASIPEWEAYSLSEIARRSHLPWGVFQYVPAKGEGFPEDFIPFKKMDSIVNAKY